MGDIQTLSEVSMNASELRKRLESVKERDKELGFRAAKTEEYLVQIHAVEKPDQLFHKIASLEIPRLKDSHINKIIDIMPASVRDLKVVLQGYSLTASNDNMKKIIDILKGFADKKS